MADELVTAHQRCRKCGVEKPLLDFYKSKSNRGGFVHVCKACDLARRKEWSLSHPGHDAAKMRAWAKENPERKKAKDRELYERNREARMEYGAAYYQANKEKRTVQSKQYREKNAEQIRSQRKLQRVLDGDVIRARRQKDYKKHKANYVANARLREERKRKRMPVWANLDAIKEFYREAERLTQETGIKHHVDHIYPLQGKLCSGLHVENNLRVITAYENLLKGNSMPELIDA